MAQRRSEKTGWVVGWLGGFLWLGLLSILWLVQGRTACALLGLGLFAAAVLAVLALVPWKHPGTRYWKLMLPIYAILAVSVGLCIWLGGGLHKLGLSWWSLVWLMPLSIPFATVGKRRWKDGSG